jgi:His/Glu/Gln/Arg/opine family amino acid ABC transporter permease subunit
MAFLDKYFETIIETGYYNWLLDGFGNTLLITLGALLIGVVIGTVIAVVKYFGEDIAAMKPLCWLCDLYTTVIRGVPVVVLLLITYFIIFASSDNGVLVAIITFGINSGAYMAELIRGGIQSVDKGQMEAGRSLGLYKLQTMVKIIFPQAIRYILPAIGNEMIALLKETSVAGYVAVRDVTKAGDQIRNLTYDAVSPLLTVALTYLALVVLMTALLNVIEKRLAKSDKG